MKGGNAMTPAGKSELIGQCVDSARDLLAATRRRAVLDAEEEIEEPLLEAIAALELALALARVHSKSDLRAQSKDPAWIERKYDSERK
jgi:hypothetical protein